MVRLKHRYIICQVISEPTFNNNNNISTLTNFDNEIINKQDYNTREIQSMIKEKIHIMWGDYGSMYSSGIAIKFYDEHTKIFILRISREAETEVRFSLSLITTLRKTNVIVRTLAISGSRTKCLENLSEKLEIAVNSKNQFTIDEKNARLLYYKNFLSTLEL